MQTHMPIYVTCFKRKDCDIACYRFFLSSWMWRVNHLKCLLWWLCIQMHMLVYVSHVRAGETETQQHVGGQARGGPDHVVCLMKNFGCWKYIHTRGQNKQTQNVCQTWKSCNTHACMSNFNGWFRKHESTRFGLEALYDLFLTWRGYRYTLSLHNLLYTHAKTETVAACNGCK